MSDLNPVIVAYQRGYRVSEEGKLYGTKGQELPIKLRSTQAYPIRQVSINGKKKNYSVHRLAAYCFYGDNLFVDGITVRHLNGDVLDCSKKNIALGTIRENHMDKCPKVRSNSARIASESRKDFTMKSLRKLSDSQAREVKILLKEGIDGVSISKRFGVSDEVIYQIKKGETYKDIQI